MCDFLDDLQSKRKIEHSRIMPLVEDLWSKGHGHKDMRRFCKPFPTIPGIFELKPSQGGAQTRIFFCFQGNAYYLVHAYAKKDNRVHKTDQDTIKNRHQHLLKLI